MLGHVLQTFQAAEVHRGLERLGLAPHPVGLDPDRHRGALRDLLQRRTEALRAQDRRHGAVRHPAQLLDRQLDLVVEPLQDRPVLTVLELLAREREVDAQRQQPLLCAVVQLALDSFALGLADLEQPRARRAQLALERAVLDRDERRRHRGAHELRILGERLVQDHRRDRVPGVVDRHPDATVSGGGGDELLAVDIVEAARRGIAVAELQRGIVERSGDRVPPLPGRGTRGEPLEHRAQRRRGEPVRLQERDQEPEREQHARRHDAPRQRARAWPGRA